MYSIDSRVERVFGDFEQCEGSEILIPAFKRASREQTVWFASIRDFGEKTNSLVVVDALVAEAEPESFKASLALRKLGNGLALVLCSGPSEDLISNHYDILANPPIYTNYKDAARTGVYSKCYDCSFGLLAIARTSYTEPRMNLFARDLKMGSDKTSWLFSTLQQVNAPIQK